MKIFPQGQNLIRVIYPKRVYLRVKMKNLPELKQIQYVQGNGSGHTVKRRSNMLEAGGTGGDRWVGTRGEWKHRLWAGVALTLTHTHTAVCLSDCQCGFLPHVHTQTKTHLSISLPLLPPLTFPFLLLVLAPSCFLCLCTQTNQSSFDLLEMSLASERHSECDEWVEGGGGLLDALEMQDGWYGGAFSAKKLLSNSRAHY